MRGTGIPLVGSPKALGNSAAIWAAALVALSAASALAKVYESPLHQLASGDFFGDGRNEVAYIRSDYTIFVHDFSGGRTMRVPTASANEVMAADLDGDGRQELAFIDRSTGYVRAYSFASGAFSTIANDAAYRDLTAGDADGDGVSELLLSRSSDNGIRYYKGGVLSNPGISGARMVSADFNPATPGAEFAMMSGSVGGAVRYYDPDNSSWNPNYGGGGGLQEFAAGNLYADAGAELLLNANADRSLWINDPSDGWHYPSPLEYGKSPAIGRLSGGLPAGVELSYVIQTGAPSQIMQNYPNDPLHYLPLRQDGSNAGSAAATNNSDWGDMIVADVDGDGLEEIVARKAADLNSLHRFDNGDAGFSLSKATWPSLVADPSFEAAQNADVANNVPSPYWTEVGFGGYHAIFDPTNGQFAGTAGDDVQGTLPDGGQVGLTEASNSIYQDIGPVIAGQLYMLDFFVGDRADGGPTNYRVELLAGGVPFLSIVNPATPPNGQWSHVYLSATAPGDATGALTLRFTQLGSGQTFYDAVTLNLPEPGTLSLLGLGGLAMLLRRRRRA